MDTETCSCGFRAKYYRLRRVTLLFVLLSIGAAVTAIVQPQFINDLSQRVAKRVFLPPGTLESYPVHIEYEFKAP